MPESAHIKGGDGHFIVAKAFIFHRNKMTGDDQVLLLVRSQTDPRRPGALDIPGGEVDTAETLQQGLAREIKEEAGIDIDPASLTEITESGAVPNETNVEKHVFVVRVEDPMFTLSFEHESAAWYPAHEAVHLFAHPFYGKVLQFILDHKLNESA